MLEESTLAQGFCVITAHTWARKPVFGDGTTKAQTSLRICAVLSALLLFTFWKVSYLNLLYHGNFNYLASLFSRGDWFESCFVGNPEDRFVTLRPIYGPRRKKTCLRGLANNTGADQPVHPCSLISTFVIQFLESIIS